MARLWCASCGVVDIDNQEATPLDGRSKQIYHAQGYFVAGLYGVWTHLRSLFTVAVRHMDLSLPNTR
jgi:hypothetical protein